MTGRGHMRKGETMDMLIGNEAGLLRQYGLFHIDHFGHADSHQQKVIPIERGVKVGERELRYPFMLSVFDYYLTRVDMETAVTSR